MQDITIKNNGNLALKYKIVISGIKGDAKLNNAIDWTISNSGGTPVTSGVATIDATASETVPSPLETEYVLLPNATNNLTISGHMKEDAGNEYQGLSIDGIAITVVATQDTVEYDSTTNQYDKDAVVVYHYYAGSDNYPYTFASFGSDTLTSTVVDSNYWWDKLYSENGYSANGHNVISLNQNQNDKATFTDCIFLCDVGNVHSAEHGTLTFKDCTFYGWVHFGNPTGAKILFENCTFTSSSDVKIGSDAARVTFKNCTFEEKQTIVDTATMKAEYSYAGECGRIMLWSDTTFENCTVAREVYKGEGVTVTGELPTLVSTAAELSTAVHKGGNILLLNDIRVESWTSVSVQGGHTGTALVIDGNGHTITGLTKPLLTTNSTSDLTVKNLTIKDSVIAYDSAASTSQGGNGAILPSLNGYPVTLENCHLKNVTVKDGEGNYCGVGGFIGQHDAANLSITDCSVTNCVINSTSNHAGAIIGHYTSNAAKTATIENCTVTGGSVNGSTKGQIVGCVNGRGTLDITSCTFTGDACGYIVDATVNVH